MFGFEYTLLTLVSLTVPQFLPLYNEDANSTYPMQWQRKIKCKVRIYGIITQFLAILCTNRLSL